MNKFFVEINRLRAVAIILVLIDHFQSLVRYVVTQGSTLAECWIGVDLFLVISGFVITNTFYKAYLKSGYNIEAIYTFYFKRFYRIVPAMLVVLFINFFLFYILKYFGYVDSWALDSTSRIKGIASILMFVSNLYYGKKGVLPPFDLGYFWSIALEWQFYCLFPIIIYFCLDNWKSRICTIFILLVGLIGLRYWEVFSSPLLRYDGFIVGILIFFIDFSLRSKLPRANKAGVVNKIYMLLLIISLTILPKLISGPLSFTFIAIVSGCIVYFCSLDIGYLSYGKLLNKILDYIGNRSYLIYLTHMTSFLIIRAACFFMKLKIDSDGHKKTLMLLMVYIFVQVIFVELLAKYIEKPGIKKSRNLKLS